MSNQTADRIKKLLGQGVSQVAAAMAVGVTESYVSQLMADEDFAAEVNEAKSAALSGKLDRDTKYDGLEDKLLKKLENLLPLMHKPAEILAALKIVNGAERRGAEVVDTNKPTVGDVVILTIPVQAVTNIQYNAAKEIISVNDRPLLPMTLEALQQKVLGAQDAKQTADYQPIAAPTQVRSGLANRIAFAQATGE